MKRLSYLLTALLVFEMASCSSSNGPKEITPTSTEFTSGELAKFVEVVDEPCQLSYAEQDGAIGSQYIKLKVKLRLTKETPELQNVDARDIAFTGLLSVATVNLVDKNETKVVDLDVKSEDLLKLKKLLQGNLGDDETITFEGVFHNSEGAPKWFEQATAFTPFLTADVEYPRSNDQSSMNSFADFDIDEALDDDLASTEITQEDTNPSLEVILPSALRGKVEIVYCGDVVEDEYGFPEVEIGFKLLQTVNTSSLVSSYGQMWIVGVGLDEQGRNVKELLPSYGEWRTGDSDGSEFKQFLESEPGETINMTFTGGNDGDVSEGINKVAKFKLKITN